MFVLVAFISVIILDPEKNDFFLKMRDTYGVDKCGICVFKEKPRKSYLLLREPDRMRFLAKASRPHFNSVCAKQTVRSAGV